MTDNDKVPELTNHEFEEYIKEGLVLIDFFAEWCMPCLVMEPVVDDLSETFKGKVKFGKVDIGDNEELAHKFDVHSIPNFILFQDGKKIEQFIGSISRAEFEEKLNKFVE
jgi:thioredoxin 1